MFGSRTVFRRRDLLISYMAIPSPIKSSSSTTWRREDCEAYFCDPWQLTLSLCLIMSLHGAVALRSVGLASTMWKVFFYNSGPQLQYYSLESTGIRAQTRRANENSPRGGRLPLSATRTKNCARLFSQWPVDFRVPHPGGERRYGN